MTSEIMTIIFSVAALLISMVAVYFSGRANNINKNIFKRQGIIDLFMTWQGISEIDSNNLINPDIVKSANALALTSTLWNHDVIDKNILYQTYWEPFRNIYDKLNSLDSTPPGLKKTCKSMISSDMTRAYQEMQKYETSMVKISKL